MLQRLAHASIRRPRRAVAAWLVLLVVAIAATPVLLSSLTTDMGGGDGTESERAGRRLGELVRQLPPPDPATAEGPEVIAVVDGLALDDAATERAVRAATQTIAALPGVRSVVDAYRSDDAALRSVDGQASVVLVGTAPGTSLEATTAEVRAALERTGAPTVVVGHEDLADDEIEAQAEEDLLRGEAIALPLAFVALVVVFGGLLAATLPLIIAVASITGALLVLTLATLSGDVVVYSLNVVTMLGIGVGIDAGLVVVSRFREERAHGLAVDAALRRTVATAGRTVGFSGLTVAVALCGLLVFDSGGLRSLAIGGIGVVLVAVLASVSLVPALLALVGHRLRPARSRAEPGFFWRVAAWVRQRALGVVVVIGTVLVVAAVPFLHARFENPDARSLPASSEARQLEEMRSRFPSVGADPIEVVAMTRPDDPALASFTSTIDGLDGVVGVDVDEDLAPAGAVVVEVVAEGPAQGTTARRLVDEVRAVEAPFEALVTGSAAELVDLTSTISARLPIALGLVGTATIVLLFLMTGSIVVAVKAVVMNVLSLGATFGVLVWVFQDGHLSGLLGFDAVGTLDATMPLIVFLFAFGLSMDYEVVLLARIEEEWAATGDNDLAIARGLDRTGGIITSAAALMVIVFAGFAAGELVLIKQLGVGMAVAVLVDAVVVRTLLVPAAMTLMGERNWWSPRPLRRLHARWGLREAPAGTGA